MPWTCLLISFQVSLTSAISLPIILIQVRVYSPTSSPVPGLKDSNLRQHDEDPCLHSKHAHSRSFLLLPVSSLMLLIRVFRDIYAFFYPLCPMNSEDFFFSSVLPTTLKQLSHLAFTFHGSEPPISTQNHAEAHAGTRDRNTEMHKKASKEHSWITKKKSSNGNRIGLN